MFTGKIMKEYKLKFQLVPDSCWYSNLRTVLPPKIWKIIRADAISRSGGKCAICGREKPLEAHEVWEYDEQNGIQKLTDVMAVCKMCHSVIHIGRTTMLGKEDMASSWFMKINGCSYSEYRQELGKANEEHIKRNQIPEWKLDVSWLNKFDNGDLNK